MDLDQYMFDEAFDFKDDRPSFQQKNNFQDPPPIERWPPLGAASDDNASVTMEEENRYYSVYSSHLVCVMLYCFSSHSILVSILDSVSRYVSLIILTARCN